MMDRHCMVDCGALQGSKAGSHDPKRTHLRPQPLPKARTAPKPHHSLHPSTAPLHGSIRSPYTYASHGVSNIPVSLNGVGILKDVLT